MNTDKNIVKSKALSMLKADAAADIKLINQYALKELRPEDVYCFSVALTNNDVDRDGDYFSSKSLRKLAKMFVGKTGIMDHDWTVKNQISRIYRAEVEATDGTNFRGEPLEQLKASVYILRNDETQPIIDKIEGGIIKEVSIGFQITKRLCSICGKELVFDYDAWGLKCENGHEFGKEYDGQICYSEMADPTDAYEFSFVAVPANAGAGIVKGYEGETGGNAYDILMKMSFDELSKNPEANEALIKHLKTANMKADERARREQIRKYAESL